MRLRGVTLGVLTLAGCSGIQASAEQIEAAKEQCVDLSRGGNVTAGGTWEKEGKLVIELQERESSFATSYRQRLCVVDFEAGTVGIPSVFEQGRWRN